MIRTFPLSRRILFQRMNFTGIVASCHSTAATCITASPPKRVSVRLVFRIVHSFDSSFLTTTMRRLCGSTDMAALAFRRRDRMVVGCHRQ